MDEQWVPSEVVLKESQKTVLSFSFYARVIFEYKQQDLLQRTARYYFKLQSSVYIVYIQYHNITLWLGVHLNIYLHIENSEKPYYSKQWK